MHAEMGKDYSNNLREAGRGSVNWIHVHSSGYGPKVVVVKAVINIWVILIVVRFLAK
jgi:hypothetical protein